MVAKPQSSEVQAGCAANGERPADGDDVEKSALLRLGSRRTEAHFSIIFFLLALGACASRTTLVVEWVGLTFAAPKSQFRLSPRW
jgi:hypothetical protein